ncbi:hypothetical protein [Streptomyces syringium]|uniref:hypothetical protein n=1 Tax=Streptomyces syringium TaxID=76729 RepID=UPI0034221339
MPRHTAIDCDKSPLLDAVRIADALVTTRRREYQPMSAQPDHAPLTPHAPAPGAPAA